MARTAAAKSDALFTPDFFRFLGELRLHNERPWFEANKQRYEESVKEPTLRLIEALQPLLRKVSQKIVVDPRPVGGSMMRIYRDIRFSKDKTPYKPYVAAMFHHQKGKEGSAPGYYLHLEPGESALGCGVWRPEGPALKGIRDAIVSEPARWKKVTSGLTKGSGCTMIGESLKRPPPGYPPDHELIEDLKRKDFGVSVRFADRDVLSPEFPEALAQSAREMAPFMSFLAEAMGESF